MQDPDSGLLATITAASSPRWSDRATAGHDLARRAERDDIAELLLRLLLDEHDTAVTDATSHALLQRDDTHGVQLIAQAVAAANDEQLDHLYTALGQHLLPHGPVAHFIDLCTELTQRPNPAVRTGALQFLTWIKSWAPPA
ncbi:hypothetical protein ACL02O_16850 [Micromonospora sp. MS34]|uniref:hypothetical protein n=1 Tax=Micromonospora sp. MS34 TaxID=3385971 RepID=UPI00399FCF66